MMKKSRSFVGLLLALALVFTSLVQPVSADGGVKTDRLEGADRYASAAKVAKEHFKDADAVIVVNATAFADAISATNISKGSYPILYTTESTVPAETKSAIEAIKPANIYILGGPSSVSASVEANLKGLGSTITRVDGADRYETSAKAANYVNSPKKIVVTTGQVFADALVAAPYAYQQDGAVLLTNKTLAPKTKAYLESHKSAGSMEIIGGTTYVPDSLKTALETAFGKSAKRIQGANRYVTSANVAKEYFQGATVAMYASGDVFADALIATPLSQKLNAPILLLSKNKMVAEIMEYLKANKKLEQVYVIGGKNTIMDKLLTEVNKQVFGAGSDVPNTEDPDVSHGPEREVDVSKLPIEIQMGLKTLEKDMDTSFKDEVLRKLNSKRSLSGYKSLEYDPDLSVEAGYIALTFSKTAKLPEGGQYHAGNEYYHVSPVLSRESDMDSNVEMLFKGVGGDSTMSHIGMAKVNDFYCFYLAGNFTEDTDHLYRTILTGSQDTSAAQEMQQLVNSYRKSQGLSQLTVDPVLTKLAQARAQEATGLMTHVRPNGKNYKAEFAGTGMYTYMGEALGSAESAQYMFDNFVSHKAHRAILDHKDYTHIGAAAFRASDGRMYWDIILGVHGKRYDQNFQLQDLSSLYK